MGIAKARVLGAAALLAAALLAPAAASVDPAAAATSAFGPPVVVGFDWLTSPYGVAVAADRSVIATSYVADSHPAQVVRKPAGAQVTLPFDEIGSPFGVAVDSAGSTYVTDPSSNQVLKLASGAGAATVLGFTGLSFPTGIAVDSSGAVFVADSGNARVVKLPTSGPQTTVAFTGLQNPYGVAVDSTAVYVVDATGNDVKKLPTGGSQTTLAFTGLSGPDGITVNQGNVYVADADNNRVVELPSGGVQTTLAFGGLSAPAGVAVDARGSVYVADSGNDRVVELPVPGRTAAQSFVIAAYNDYIQRDPTGSELAAGVSSVGDVTVSTNRANFVKGLANSEKYLGAFVNKLYLDTLGRAGDSGGLAFWADKLRTKAQTPAQVSANFYASAEYFNGFGAGDFATWVKDLYTKVLHRTATSGEVSSGVATAQSKGRYAEAYSLFQSLESRKVRVTGLYQRFLNRAPDAGGRDYWAGRVLNEGDIALAINLSTSAEYLNKSALRYP